jgi:hypothetical protein
VNFVQLCTTEKARTTTKMVTLIVIYSLCSSSLLIINKVQLGPLSYAPHVAAVGCQRCRMLPPLTNASNPRMLSP